MVSFQDLLAQVIGKEKTYERRTEFPAMWTKDLMGRHLTYTCHFFPRDRWKYFRISDLAVLICYYRISF